MKVILDRKDIRKCRVFAEKFINSEKSEKDFGNINILRDNTDRIADCFEGKVGERAFEKLCQAKGLKILIDYSIDVGIHNIDDGQDISELFGVKPKLKCDIKTAKSYAKWLVVESHKASPKLIKSDIYIFIKTDLPSDIEKNLDNINVEKVTCEFVGYAFYSDLFDINENPWFHFNNTTRTRLYSPKFIDFCYSKAKQKYGTITDRRQIYEFFYEARNNIEPFMNVKLKAPLNYGLPLNFLRKDIKALFNIIRKDFISNKLLSSSSLIIH